MTKFGLTGLGLFFITAASFAQTTDVSLSCSEAKTAGFKKLKALHWPKNAGLDLYDVHYHKLDISLTNTSIYVAGKVTTQAEVTNAPLGSFVFELHPSLTLDSVKVEGQPTTVTVNGTFKECGLASALPIGTAFTAEIWYHGTPTAIGTSAIGEGISTGQSPSWGNFVTWTLSEPYSAYEWWPCKQSLSDKIDSVDVWITVGDSLKAGSNGLLKQVTPISGNRLRYEWKHRYLIDYYLISASVAKYVDYSFYAHPQGGTMDSVLVQNYIYDNPQTLNYFQTDIDQTADFMEAFAQIFGPYPFENEKYGHCMAPFGGGMEHQTMTSQGSFDFTLTSHELAHQWFGDMVTCGSWKDIWVNEGFASYSEFLALQMLQPNQAMQHMNDYHSSALSQPGGSVYVDDTTNPDRIFDGRLTYDKGGALVHMVRFLVNDDAVFFQALRNYLQAHAYSTATGEDLKNAVATTAGVNLDNLFDEYYYGEGYPTFSLRWRKAPDGRVYLKLSQTASKPSVTPLFHIPVEVKLLSSSGDTTVRVMADAPEVLFDFAYARNVTAAQIDPNQWILNQTGSVLQDQTLGIVESALPVTAIFPNPATEQLTLTGFAPGETLSLVDATGKIIRSILIQQTSQVISVNDLANGTYLLKGADAVHRFVKK